VFFGAKAKVNDWWLMFVSDGSSAILAQQLVWFYVYR